MQFSIIIPHKNSAFLLNRLINSIPKNKDYQIIVIDDNSTSEEFAKVERIKKYRDFELYVNKGIGAGGARNTGLDYVKGEWILFADADDFFLPSFSKLVNKYKSSNDDIIYFKVTSCYSDSLLKANRDEHINKLFELYAKNGDENLFRCRYTPPWGKMIRKRLIKEENINFEECSAGNDNWFSVNTGLKAVSIKVVDIPIYCVTIVPGSITTSLTKQKFEARFYSTLRTNSFLRKNKKNKYQLSILYFLFKARYWGIKYEFKIISECFKYGANPFIGLNKIFNTHKILSNREYKKIEK